MTSEGQHHAIERFERWWIFASLVLLAIFVALLFYALAMHGDHIGHAEPRAPVGEIMAREVFANPGVREIEPGLYEAGIVAAAFSFIPGEIEIPAGSEVIFHLTSRDVIHGFHVLDTAINVELIPGEAVSLRYRFDRSGEHRIVCNQYCGIAHQNMVGMIRVVDPDEVAPEVEVDEADPDEPPDWMARGERAYTTHCRACHQAEGQGLPPAFPPLAGHMPGVVNAEGGRDHLVDVVLYGLGGRISVLGVDYNALMPGMPHLSDADVAAALNFSLYAWGNDEALPEDFEPYTADEVATRRGQNLTPAEVNARRPQIASD